MFNRCIQVDNQCCAILSTRRMLQFNFRGNLYPFFTQCQFADNETTMIMNACTNQILKWTDHEANCLHHVLS